MSGHKTFSFNTETFLVEILKREGWQEAPRGTQPDFSMHAARKPMPGKPPPMHPELQAQAARWRQANPVRPPAHIRMHCDKWLIALNDKVTFWQALQSSGLEHLHPATVLLEEYLADVGATLTALSTSDCPLRFLKQRSSENGREVFCFTSNRELEDFVAENNLRKDASRWIVQVGIRPYLVDGRKSVLRVFTLALGSQAYVHKEFLVKVLSGEYSEHTDDAKVHVSCTAGQPNVDISRGTAFPDYAHIFQKLCHSIGLITASFTDVLDAKPDAEGLLYTLIGFDFIIDANKELIALEANAPPSLFEILDATAKDVKMEMQEDFYRFVILGGGKEPQDLGGFVPVGIEKLP
eukprot:TRINITY_DN97003_c0_g1_i1.p1 TRINITY_DN97003_c0_g1~~TRINITY_DN97003_c0_g1_i1.p1  ORF type:complete len:351 (+),score=66.02 TRINITY_DN97003_c0_g1_i1:43-1095(+)